MATTTPFARTREEIRMEWKRHPAVYSITIPKGTRCRRITEGTTAGRYWIEDLSWIPQSESFLRHDATHYGIDIAADLVEPLT